MKYSPINLPPASDPLATDKDVRAIYEFLVENCMGITREDMQLPFNVLEKLEFPELHERSFPNLILFRHTAKLAKMCGVRDFSMTDIIAPDAKRTLFILSAIINFEKFRVDRLTHFARYQQDAVRIRSIVLATCALCLLI